MTRNRWSLALLAVAVALHASVWPSLGLAWTRPGAWLLAAVALALVARATEWRRAASYGGACLAMLALPLVATAVLGYLDPNASLRLDGIEVGPWPGRVLWMTGLAAVPVAAVVTLAVRRGTPTVAGGLAVGLFATSVTVLLSGFSADVGGMSAQVPALLAGWLGHGLVVYELVVAALGEPTDADRPASAASEA